MADADARERPDPLAARALALAVLELVETEQAHADRALARALAASALDTRDRAFAARLVYGTLAWQGRLDWHLATLTGRDPAHLDRPLRHVLRLGLYQILFLDRVPAHAAVATSVDLARRVAPRAAGLVNAVLRRATREGASLPLPAAEENPVAHLACATSHPAWLVARWRERFAPDDLAALLAADNEAAPTVVRARPGRREALLARLATAGVQAVAGRFAPDAVHLEGGDPHALPEFATGLVSVQSEASQLIAPIVAPRAGMRVLDACAAPGGKAAHLADLMTDRGLVVALDRRRGGAAAVAGTARRLGLRTLAPVTGDAQSAARLFAGVAFDRILVDAPCSGLGTLRAHPEVRWRRGPDDVARLADLQRGILEAVTPLLAADGVLVYATCTLMAEENEEVVAPWLGAHPELVRESVAASLPEAARPLVDAEGALRTLPHRDGLDGFYAVRIRRRA